MLGESTVWPRPVVLGPHEPSTSRAQHDRQEHGARVVHAGDRDRHCGREREPDHAVQREEQGDGIQDDTSSAQRPLTMGQARRQTSIERHREDDCVAVVQSQRGQRGDGAESRERVRAEVEQVQDQDNGACQQDCSDGHAALAVDMGKVGRYCDGILC